MNAKRRILLADDHVLFRRGLASLFAQRPEFELVGEADDGEEAVAKAGELKPDLVLMDIRMPKLSGLEAARHIKARWPEIKVVMLTVSDEEADLFEAIKAGVQGYLLKDVKPGALFEYIEGVFRGEAALTPVIAQRVLEEFARLSQLRQGVTEAVLTAREEEILRSLVEGASNREIARRLHLTEGTVKNHIHSILEKLHLQNRVQAAAWARRHGRDSSTLGPEGEQKPPV